MADPRDEDEEFPIDRSDPEFREFSKIFDEEFAAYSRHLSDLWATLPPRPRKRAVQMIIHKDYQKRFAARSPKIEAEVAAIRARWLDDYRDGARCGSGLKIDGARCPGGYPHGFQSWPLDRRNAWFAGYNQAVSNDRA